MQPQNPQQTENCQMYPNLDINKSQLNPYTTTSPPVNYPLNQSNAYNPFTHQPVIKTHIIRNHKTWHDIIKEAADWVNTKLHVLRVITISVVFCHSTGAAQITIFYNDSDDHVFKEFISNNLNRTLGAALIETTKTWEKHHSKLMEAVPNLSSTGGIIGICELEVDHTHGRALSVIWFRK